MRDRAETPIQIDSKSSDHNAIFPVGKEGGIPDHNRGKMSLERRKSKKGMNYSEKLRNLGRN